MTLPSPRRHQVHTFKDSEKQQTALTRTSPLPCQAPVWGLKRKKIKMKIKFNKHFITLIITVLGGASQLIAQTNLTPIGTWALPTEVVIEENHTKKLFHQGSQTQLLEEGKYYNTVIIEGRYVMIPKFNNTGLPDEYCQKAPSYYAWLGKNLGFAIRPSSGMGSGYIEHDACHNKNDLQRPEPEFDPVAWKWVATLNPKAATNATGDPINWKDLGNYDRYHDNYVVQKAGIIGGVLHLAREIHLLRTREGGETNYPAGTPFITLSTGNQNPKDPWVHALVIQIGNTKEQCVIPWQVVKEAGILTEDSKRWEAFHGGQNGPTLTTTSIQFSDKESRINDDGPAGNFTGLATGGEDISRHTEWEKEALRLMNIERAKAGVCQLVWNEDMARAGRYQAAAVYVGDYYVDSLASGKAHTSFAPKIINGKRYFFPRDVTDPRNTRFSSKAENEIGDGILHEPYSANGAIQGWLHSPPHRKAMLNPTYTEVGIGFGTGSSTNSGIIAFAVLGGSTNCKGKEKNWVKPESVTLPGEVEPISATTKLP